MSARPVVDIAGLLPLRTSGRLGSPGPCCLQAPAAMADGAELAQCSSMASSPGEDLEPQSSGTPGGPRCNPSAQRREKQGGKERGHLVAERLLLCRTGPLSWRRSTSLDSSRHGVLPAAHTLSPGGCVPGPTTTEITALFFFRVWRSLCKRGSLISLNLIRKPPPLPSCCVQSLKSVNLE